MNVKESKVLEELINNVKSLTATVKELQFQNSELSKIVITNSNKPHEPFYLENDILQCSISAINTAISKCLTEYNSPLIKLVALTINENSKEIKGIVEECLHTVISNNDFRASIMNAFSHKLARNFISANEGLLDKVIGDLKTDHTFRAKLTLVIDDLFNDYLSNVSKQ